MDTQKIQKICDEYLAYRESDDYFEDNNWEYYIYETVMQAVFGEGIWERFKEIGRQKSIKRKKKEIEKLQDEIDKEN